MAERMPPKKCKTCKIESYLTRSCVICNEVLCFECAYMFDPRVTPNVFAKVLYFICRRKCMDKYKENCPVKVTPEQTEKNFEEKSKKSPSVTRYLEDSPKPGPSQGATAARNDTTEKRKASFTYHTTSCAKCFRLQPDFRICRECGWGYYYYCEDECWNIKDEYDSSGKKIPGNWACHWCETGRTGPVRFQSNKKRFIRLVQDFMAPLDVLVDTDPAFADTFVDDHFGPTWITVNPPKRLRDLPKEHELLTSTFEVPSTDDINEAILREDIQQTLEWLKKRQEDAKAAKEKEKLNDVVVAEDSDDLLEVAEEKFASMIPRVQNYPKPLFKPLTPEQQALLDDALIDTSPASPVKSLKPDIPAAAIDSPTTVQKVEKRLENIRRDIEDIETITRAFAKKVKVSTPKSKIDKFAASLSEATVKNRIQAAQRAVEAFSATTRQMKETTMEDIRLALDGKVKCLLKIWEDMGKGK